MPITQEMLDKYIEEHGPWSYHTTHLTNVDDIEKEGLVYHEDRLDTGDAGSRPGHHYLYVGVPRNFAQFKIDLRKLNPEDFMLDTDAATVMDDWKESWEMGEGAVYYVKEYFDEHPHWDEPENVLKGMTEHHTFAYKADIPPDAISRNELFWDNEHNVNRYNDAVGREQDRIERLTEFEREYHERQEKARNSPEERTYKQFVWLENGEVWRKYEGGGLMPEWAADITDELRFAMAERGYLNKDDYEMRLSMIKIAEQLPEEKRHLIYNSKTDQLGEAFLKHHARMQGLEIQEEMKPVLGQKSEMQVEEKDATIEYNQDGYGL